MFNMTGNRFNNGNGVSVNTRLYTSYSDSCLLTLGAWNEQFSLKFAPFKGKDANGVNQYATDRSEIISTSLMVDNCITFTNGIDEIIKPALKEKKAAEVSVTIGNGDNRKVLKMTTDGETVSLSIYLSVNDNGVSTGDHITHTFNKREYMTSYDPTTGANESVVVNSDFENFVEKLEKVQDLTQISTHASKYGTAISNAYSKPANQNYGGGQGNYGNSAPSPQTNTYSSMDDFLPFN